MSTNPEDIDLFAGLPLAQTGAEGTSHPAAVHLAAAAQRNNGHRRLSAATDPFTAPVSEPPTVPPLAAATEPSPDTDPTEDLHLIDRLSGQVSEARPNYDETPQNREEIGRAIIAEVLTAYSESRVRVGGESLSRDQYDKLQRILFNNAYKLGPLQQFLDDPTVENVHILGCDDVVVRYTDGTSRDDFPPVALSDEALTLMIQSWSSEKAEGAREFNANTPQLALALPGGERLQAAHPPISERPTVTIRCHRLKDISLQDLVEKETLSQVAADFLSACVKAKMSIVVSGAPGSGKTTFIRALCASLDYWEPVITIETERELQLSNKRHRNLRSLEARPGKGEKDSNTGLESGEVTLTDLLSAALRFDAQRIIVGEVRDREVVAMFGAFAAAPGSMTTVHAGTSQDAIAKLAALQQNQSGTSPAFAYRQIQDHVSIVAQLARHTEGGQPRLLTEIAEVRPTGDGEAPAANLIFASPRPGQEAVFTDLPHEALLRELEFQGFSRDRFQEG